MKEKSMWKLCEIFKILQIQKIIISMETIHGNTVVEIYTFWET